MGLSAVSSTGLRRACKITHVAAVQVEYSAFALDIEGPKSDHFLETCRKLGVAVVVAMPLGRGILISSYANNEIKGDMRTQMMARFLDENKQRNIKLVQTWTDLAKKKDCTVT